MQTRRVKRGRCHQVNPAAVPPMFFWHNHRPIHHKLAKRDAIK